MSPIVKYILRNIGTRPFLSTLVFMSMVVVGATLSGVAAITAGLKDSSKTTGRPTVVLATTRGATLESDSNLSPEDLNTISTSNDVTRSSPEVLARNHVVLNGALDFAMLRGVEPQAYDMHGIHLLEGRLPAPGEREMIVGDVMLQHFPELKIGGSLGMMGMDIKVVGVFHAAGFLSGEAWTSRQLFQTNPKLNDLSSVYLETPNAEAAARVSAKLTATRGLDIAARPEPDFYSDKIKQFDYLIKGLVLIFSLVVTGAVLAAASLLSVFQLRRLSEQSVMRAMGFRTARIAWLIGVETMLLVLPGGAVGAVVAWFVLRNYVVSALAPSMAMVMYRAPLTLPLAGLAMVGMCIVGVIGAIAPITRMTRTQITRGLREE